MVLAATVGEGNGVGSLMIISDVYIFNVKGVVWVHVAVLKCMKRLNMMLCVARSTPVLSKQSFLNHNKTFVKFLFCQL